MSEGINVNKFIADCGVCSRRQADVLIKEGRVKFNNRIARRGDRVLDGDKICVDGKLIEKKPSKNYILLYKPEGVSSGTHPDEPDNLLSYLKLPFRVYPVGRLDKESEGLLLVTDDGDIVNKILRAEHGHEKEYIVTVDHSITADFLNSMRNGVQILDTVTLPCIVNAVDDTSFRIILTQGLNRQIRRMCSYLGYKVVKLIRTRIMHLTMEGLEYGKWRALSEDEIIKLHEHISSD